MSETRDDRYQHKLGEETPLASTELSDELRRQLIEAEHVSAVGEPVAIGEHLTYPEKPPRKRRRICRTSRRSCCDQILDVLATVPGVDHTKLHKPKQPNKVKTACLCDRWPVGDAVGPLVLHVLERYLNQARPGNELEKELFQFLAGLPEPQTAALRASLNAYKEQVSAGKACQFRNEYTAIPQDKPIDVDTMAIAWIEEGLIHTRYRLHGETACQPGKVRNWEATLSVDPDTPAKNVTAPWPFICSINGLRKGDHRPPLTVYGENEYEQTCNYTLNKLTNEITPNCIRATWPSCSGGYHGKFCLKMPEGRVGQSVEIIGFNFFNKKCKVKLTYRDQPSVSYLIDGVVCGDSKAAVTAADGSTIADCRVRDRLSFRVPDKAPDGVNTFLPGVYRVDVIVPNDTGYARGDGIVPKEYSTKDINNTGLLNVQPSQNLKYWIRVPEAHCYEETDGEWFSDEIRITASVGRFYIDATGKYVTEQRTLQMPDVMSDADEGDNFEPKWDLIGKSLVPETLPGCTVIALVGYEVDSEDAWEEQIENWTSAFTAFMGKVWDLIKDKVKDIVGGLAKLGVKWGLIAGAVAVVITLAIAAIWAAWAPPDLMLLDMIVLEEQDLFSLTYPTAALPVASSHDVEDVTVEVKPESKILYEYAEERLYQSHGEGSLYGLLFAYRRVT